MRRLPIFILVDTSGKMEGNRLALVNRKISELIFKLRQDPFTLEPAHLFIASYNIDMRVYLPLTELASIDLPVLEAKPSTPSMLGNALLSLDSIIEKTIKKPTAKKKGDFTPILYVLTGGKPSDSASAHDAMEQIFSKRRMKLCLGLTSSNLVPFYENLFDINILSDDIFITDLNTTDLNIICQQCWDFIEDEAKNNLVDDHTLPPPPEMILINP
jgi:uncharacterized protein YegL